MKLVYFKNCLQLCVITGLISVMGALPQARATEGGWGSGGGNICAAEFITYGRVIYQAIKETKDFGSAIPLDALEKRISNATVSVTSEPLYQDGISVDAINYPDKNLIQLNRSWCSSDRSNPWRGILVFHEFLGLAGGKELDQGYRLSQQLYSKTALKPDGFLKALFTNDTISVEDVYLSNRLALSRTRLYKFIVGDFWYFDIDCNQNTMNAYFVQSPTVDAREPEKAIAEAKKELGDNAVSFRGTFSFGDRESCVRAERMAQLVRWENSIRIGLNWNKQTVEYFGFTFRE